MVRVVSERTTFVADTTVAAGGDAHRETYAGSGVDIDAGEEAVRRIKDKVRSTFRPEVIGDIGGFGGLFQLDLERYRKPVLVSSTDGVGTKALVAQAAGRFTTIGVDLVAMCVDDLVCQGAEPLFFLDYIAVGRLDPDHIEQLVEGVAEGCRQARCALVGGEMAEHPGAMDAGEFDLVGFAVGVAERDRLVTGQHVGVGDVLIGLPSPNLRSNGYSLARRILLERAGLPLDGPAYDGARHSLADELLSPSVIYSPTVLELLRTVDVRAVAHITGGGIPGNLNRVLPAGTSAQVERRSWEVPPIFGEMQRLGNVTDDEMAKVFNMGIGMVVVVPEADAQKALDVARTGGHRAVEIGRIVPGDGTVQLV
jgi:phosphoribosylformylglycinamidine cyclo-ligase